MHWDGFPVTELEPVTPQPLVGRIVKPEPAPVAYTDLDYTIGAETARRLIGAIPDNTQRAYKRNWTQFADWCDENGRVSLPATPETLADYVVRLIGIGLAPNTIDQVIGTVRSRHRRSGYRNQPDTEHTLDLLNAYRKEWADAGNRVRKATPILLDALRAMVDTCDPDTVKGVRDRALLLLGFNMMARRSELSGLDVADVPEVPEEGISAYIRSSKTDQAAQGVEVPVPYGQHAETCAVRSVRAWRQLLIEHAITDGALFRPVDRHGRLPHEAKAAGRLADRLSGKAVNLVVQHRAKLAGLSEHYTAHGLRSGAATSAYAAGIPVSAIAIHGRWSEKSPVVLGYLRAVDKWKNNPMKGIGL
jgi:site-specific recombinase XerD